MAKKPKVRKLVYEDSLVELIRQLRNNWKFELKDSVKNEAYFDAAEAEAKLEVLDELLWEVEVLHGVEGPNE